MLKNYFKIAIAVLKRRKFFTFISLFGISFTLTIIIVLAAFIDNIISANYPETNRDRSLYIISMQQRDPVHNGQMTGPMSYYFLSHYVSTLKNTNDAFWDVFQYRFIEGKPYTKQQIDNGEHVAVISEVTKKEYFGDVP